MSAGRVLPLAVVGASWRTAPTTVRARLLELDGGDESPTAELRKAGYLQGSVCVSTCSRTEWVLTADDPAWASALLKGSLGTRLSGLAPEWVQVRTGQAALHYLFAVSVGLDSVAEGETAVGRQVLRAFEKARAAGTTDKRMRLVWKQLERLMRERREQAPGLIARGVQSLVLEVLRETVSRDTHLDVIGKGEIGLAVVRSLAAHGFKEVSTWSRATMHELTARADKLQALVVCTGASEPWLRLPERADSPLCIDVGAPTQVAAAPGWRRVGLDELLSRPGVRLSEQEHERLEALVLTATAAVGARLATPTPSKTLAAIDAERAAFLNEQLPALLEGLPEERVRRVRRAVGAFAHAILQRAREVQS